MKKLFKKQYFTAQRVVDIHAYTKEVVEEKRFINISRNLKKVSGIGLDIGINK
jgi:hypothetical protein